MCSILELKLLNFCDIDCFYRIFKLYRFVQSFICPKVSLSKRSFVQKCVCPIVRLSKSGDTDLTTSFNNVCLLNEHVYLLYRKQNSPPCLHISQKFCLRI